MRVKIKYRKTEQKVEVRTGLQVAVERYNIAFERWAKTVNRSIERIYQNQRGW